MDRFRDKNFLFAMLPIALLAILMLVVNTNQQWFVGETGSFKTNGFGLLLLVWFFGKWKWVYRALILCLILLASVVLNIALTSAEEFSFSWIVLFTSLIGILALLITDRTKDYFDSI